MYSLFRCIMMSEFLVNTDRTTSPDGYSGVIVLLSPSPVALMVTVTQTPANRSLKIAQSVYQTQYSPVVPIKDSGMVTTSKIRPSIHTPPEWNNQSHGYGTGSAMRSYRTSSLTERTKKCYVANMGFASLDINC